ncbi:hypothetical protein CRENBAI_016903 [Crenichthys baileyi]|uniref:Ig-like domain-containing protein n=1 Tax=Crenichthys baileyi TaxID=28760 RepID=A0AAV9RRC1_9TELE
MLDNYLAKTVHKSGTEAVGEWTLSTEENSSCVFCPAGLKCLCQGQMMASCLSQEGDSPQYRWTQDGHTLTDSELFSRNIENSIIVLRQNTSGRRVCWG